MRVFDASSIVHAWDNYPIEVFRSLWDWMGDQVEGEHVRLPRVARDQVGQVSPECGEWLADHNCALLQPTNAVLRAALDIKTALGINNDNYHVDGVDEPDVLIIATAKVQRVQLVSDENPQPTAPRERRKFKIPRVCGLGSVRVDCINFLEYIKSAGVVFE